MNPAHTRSNTTAGKAHASSAMKLLAAATLLVAASGAHALQGERTIACVAIKWQEGTELSAAKCKNVAENVADYYRRNSRGVLQLKPLGYEVEVPYTRDAGNLGKAEAMVKRQIKADYYIIPALWKKGGNHASGKIAHIVQLTGWVTNHEVGHLLGMGHSGQYVYDANGKPHLENYGDADSVMGNNGSKYLNGPQYYKLGWLPDHEVAIYDPSVAVYELKKVSDFRGQGLSAVVIPRPGGKPAVVSYPIGCNDCAALYLTSGGTQKVGVTKTEWKDTHFTGLRLKVLGTGADTVFVQITQESRTGDTVSAAYDEDSVDENSDDDSADVTDAIVSP